MDKKTYKKYAEAVAPRSPILKNCIFAFCVGGAICSFAELLVNVYNNLGMSEENSGTLTSVTLVFIAVLLTGLGVFDKIAKHAGAGTLVPITGFANAVASPAIDSMGEGSVTGVGVKLFSVAGPVILYGIFTGVLYGVILYVMSLF